MLIPVIVAIILAAVVSLLVITQRGNVRRGALSRETLASDASGAAAPGAELEAIETTAGRERGNESRGRAGTVVPREAGTIEEWVPLDPEELSVSRRMFFNRAILFVALGAFAPTFGLQLLAFLWPSGVGGFGGTVVTKLSDAKKSWEEKKEPYYVPEARTYLQPYPSEAIVVGAKVYEEHLREKKTATKAPE